MMPCVSCSEPKGEGTKLGLDKVMTGRRSRRCGLCPSMPHAFSTLKDGNAPRPVSEGSLFLGTEADAIVALSMPVIAMPQM